MTISQPPFNPYDQPPLETYFPAVEPVKPGNGRRVLAILIPIVLLLAVTAVVVVLLTGVIQIGKPKMSGISLSPEVNETQRPAKSVTVFTIDSPAVYCCSSVKAFNDTRLEAKWFSTSGQIADYKSTFGKMTGVSAAKFATSSGRVAFKLERPKQGWSLGAYSVRLYLDEGLAGEVRFTIAKSRTEGIAGTRYDDPSGFSILVPEGWKTADKQSLGGAQAGFMAEMGPYPPRYAVSVTSFTSVAPAYLNQIVRDTGAKSDELFAQYSIGELVGARRAFNWEYDNGQGQKYSLKSIQVVVQVENRIYSIDCHSLGIDFERNEPVFNAVINSFR